MIVLFIIREELDLSENLAHLFYYLALGIFGVGIIRIAYMAIKG